MSSRYFQLRISCIGPPNVFFKILQKNRRLFEFSAYVRPIKFAAYRRRSEYPLPNFYQLLFSSWRPLEIITYQQLFEISTHWGPFWIFPLFFRKIANKNLRLPEIFLYFCPPRTFSRFPSTNDFHRTSQHLKKIWMSFHDLSIFPPTDVFLRFLFSDVLQVTFRRLFKKVWTKYLSKCTTWPILSKIETKCQIFRLPMTSLYFHLPKPSGDFSTSF